MADPYATADDLATFTGEAAPADAARLLARASELLDVHVTATFDVADATELPTDADVAAALRDATCAQVEFWLEVGEEHDVAGIRGDISTGPVSWKLPDTLAPRAGRILAAAGLVSGVAA